MERAISTIIHRKKMIEKEIKSLEESIQMYENLMADDIGLIKSKQLFVNSFKDEKYHDIVAEFERDIKKFQTDPRHLSVLDHKNTLSKLKIQHKLITGQLKDICKTLDITFE